ncbi:MAG: DUF721 domain-containing protein [Bacteroidales bacterium]|jgi:predicted nucleic acid-binding Zn ribbon protein|nr:DUF721 domain-containing protein [Bacteroidales bacterium]MCK9448229.1 DUF721 domain-containing protein [Bacteroidales bacterium]MDD3700511.1 DUF721 domain-containing protein [Bacteroidales bacterium]MDY0370518.1 DUF721 domain-containing protein [Bacteroidales bacterium]
MSASNEISIGKAIEELLRQYKLDEKIDGIRIINAWEKVVGKLIVRHTTDLFVKNKILYVHLDSDVIRNELSYARKKLINDLNQEAGKEIINEIVIR